MIEDTVELAGSFPGPCRLLFSEDIPELAMPGGIETGRQSSGDLGARLAAAFNEGFAAGAKKIVVLGSDSPHLPARFLREALDALDTDAELVLGPAEDGGYYLIAARRFSPEVFAGVEWGSARVFDQTRGAAERAGFRVATLEMFYDLDEWADVMRLVRESGTSAPRTRNRITC